MSRKKTKRKRRMKDTVFVTGLKQQRKLLLAVQSNRCFYCLQSLIESEATVDHIKPKSKGGSPAINNLVVCCFTCNSTKGTQRVNDEFVAKRIDLINQRGWEEDTVRCIKTICKLYSTA